MNDQKVLQSYLHRATALFLIASLLLGACSSGAAVDGATGYRIENQFGDSEWFTLVELPGDQLAYEDFLTPSDTELNYRLTPLEAGQEGRALSTSVTTPEVVPNPYRVTVKLEEPDYSDIGLDIPGFDPETFDPSTFDPSTLDFSAFDPENLDLSTLQPEPVAAIGRIGPEGGSLSVTGKNGVTYTLDVPTGALLFSTLLVMTPVAEIEGYPFTGGYFAAVEMRPQGINFEIPATLTIQLSDEVSAARDPSPNLVEVAFAFYGSGEEFHLTPRDTAGGVARSAPGRGYGKLAMPAAGPSQTITVAIRKVQSVGAGSAAPGQPREHAADHPTNSDTANADQKSAASQIDDELAPLKEELSDEERRELDEQYSRTFSEVQRAMSAAQTARALTPALYLFEVELFNSKRFNEYLQDVDRQILWDTAVASLYRNLGTVNCPSDEAAAIQQLVRRLKQAGTPFWAELARRFKQEYGEKGQQLLQKIEALQSCNVKLELDSTAYYSDETCRAEFKVHAEIPLTWHYDTKGYLQGAGNLEYSNPNNLPVSQGFDPGKEECLEIKIKDVNTAVFQVTRLVPQFEGDLVSDWNLEIWSVAGESSQLCRTIIDKDYVPPAKVSGCVPLPGGGEKDAWGGLVKLVELNEGIFIGGSKWVLDMDFETPLQASWKLPLSPARTSGQGYRHEHTTTLKLAEQ
jgi:hypothetical protein